MPKEYKYQYWTSEEGLVNIRVWKRNGFTNEEIARKIGVSRKTLQEWAVRFSDVRDALKESKEIADNLVENALFKKCMMGDNTAIIFYLCNRVPKKYVNSKYINQRMNLESDKPKFTLLTDILNSVKSRDVDTTPVKLKGDE